MSTRWQAAVNPDLPGLALSSTAASVKKDLGKQGFISGKLLCCQLIFD